MITGDTDKSTRHNTLINTSINIHEPGTNPYTHFRERRHGLRSYENETRTGLLPYCYGTSTEVWLVATDRRQAMITDEDNGCKEVARLTEGEKTKLRGEIQSYVYQIACAQQLKNALVTFS